MNDLLRQASSFGQRVERISTGGGRTEELFDPAGQLLGHFNGANGIWWEQYVQFDGRLLWYYTQATNTSRYFHVNALGSLGLATDQTGAPVEEMLYYPFGVRWQNTTGFGWDEKFAQFPQRDEDIQKYQASFREYAPGLGRWLTPDKLAGDVTNPQSLNRYAYVLNNPVSNIDPSGLFWQAAVPDDGTSVDLSSFGNVGLIPPQASENGVPASGSGRGTAPAAKNRTCSGVPQAPPGADVNQNIKASSWMKIATYTDPLVSLYLFRKVVGNKGPWDYKQQGWTLTDTGQLGPSPFQDFGNFNFGATGAAWGIPLNILQRGAGYAQEKAGTSMPEWGHWYQGPPYGDDPADQTQISAGYQYYENGCYKKK